MLSSIVCMASMKSMSSSSSVTTSSLRGSDNFGTSSLFLLCLIMLMAICISIFMGLLAGSNASFVLAVWTGLAAGLGLGVPGSSFSSIIDLTVDFFGAAGILRLESAAFFLGLLVVFPDGLKACCASSSSCIWSLHASLPSVVVDGIFFFLFFSAFCATQREKIL